MKREDGVSSKGGETIKSRDVSPPKISHHPSVKLGEGFQM
jgi:hypothetical protein